MRQENQNEKPATMKEKVMFLLKYHPPFFQSIDPIFGQWALKNKMIKAILKDANAIGLIPYFAFMPTRFILVCFCISVTIFIIVQVKKRKPKLS